MALPSVLISCISGFPFSSFRLHSVGGCGKASHLAILARDKSAHGKFPGVILVHAQVGLLAVVGFPHFVRFFTARTASDKRRNLRFCSSGVLGGWVLSQWSRTPLENLTSCPSMDRAVNPRVRAFRALPGWLWLLAGSGIRADNFSSPRLLAVPLLPMAPCCPRPRLSQPF